MRCYKINEQVPWRHVLHILCWYVRMKMRWLKGRLDCEDRNAIENEMDSLRKGMEAYRSLRHFLGYSSRTELERSAEDLLTQCENTLETL